jgi:sugar/nucleoside kinase (ribokinase family)
MGPKVIIIKKGSHGVISLDSSGNWFTLPAYPTKNVKDPTGAGDAFAGALMGYLASTGKTDTRYLKTAIAYGTVAASLVIEDFSLSAISAVGRSVIDRRLQQLRKMTEF